MPTISCFFGIIIRMYFLGKEHNPPHVHVIYQDVTFSITIKDLQIIDGEQSPSPRILAMVIEWINTHREELLQMWETQDIHKIEELK